VIAASLLVAVSTFAAPSWTGWHPGAWPSTNHWAWTNTPALIVPPPLVTNLTALLLTDEWSQSSTTNRIPALDSNEIPYRYHDPFGVFPFYSGGIPAYTNSTRAWVNRYLHYVSSVDMNWLVALLIGSGSISTNKYFMSGGAAQTLTTVLDWDIADAGVTSLYASVDDVWATDCLMAMAERGQGGGAMLYGATYSIPSVFLSSWPATYPGRYYNLEVFKQTIAAATHHGIFSPGTLDMTQADEDGTFNGYIASVWPSADVFPYYNETNFLAICGAPTNYVSGFTVWHDYGGGHVHAAGHVVTNSWKFVKNGTYLLYDFNGDWFYTNITDAPVTGTLVVTTSIQEGFTASDYGYKHAPNMISHLAWYSVGADCDGIGDLITKYGTGETWSAAMANLQDDTNYWQWGLFQGTAGKRLIGEEEQPDFYQAWMRYGRYRFYSSPGGDGVKQRAVDIYLQYTNYWSGISTFDAGADPLAEQYVMKFVHSVTSSATIVTQYIGQVDNAPTFGSAPVSNNVMYFKGHMYSIGGAVSRWNIPGGFVYQ